jgi:hypothetical protein
MSHRVTKLGVGWQLEEWFDQQGRLHRDGAPATVWRAQGQVVAFDYLQHGLLHRDDGIAVFRADDAGTAELLGSGREEWWRHGRPVTTEEMVSRPDPQRLSF